MRVKGLVDVTRLSRCLLACRPPPPPSFFFSFLYLIFSLFWKPEDGEFLKVFSRIKFH